MLAGDPSLASARGETAVTAARSAAERFCPRRENRLEAILRFAAAHAMEIAQWDRRSR
jgi:hypothetical protein